MDVVGHAECVVMQSLCVPQSQCWDDPVEKYLPEFRLAVKGKDPGDPVLQSRDHEQSVSR